MEKHFACKFPSKLTNKDKNMAFYYLTPPEISDKLNLTKYRQQIDGRYILSERDIEPYGEEKAINDGAIKIPHNDVKILIKNKK